MLVGFLNGILVAYTKLSSIIVTLATGSCLLGAGRTCTPTDKFMFKNIPSSFMAIGQSQLVGIPLPIIYAASRAIVIWYVLDFRPAGRHLYAIGANDGSCATRWYQGKETVLGAFVTSAALSSLGGVLVAVSSRIGPLPTHWTISCCPHSQQYF